MGGSELAFLEWIQQNLRCGALDAIMVFATRLGDIGLVWIAAGVGLASRPKSRRTGIVLLVALAVAFVLAQLVLKSIVMRPRPCDVVTGIQMLVPRPHGSSFPSAHAATAFACATALVACKSKWWPWALGLAVLIALSRMYLFVHYPSDVLAGVLVGIASGAIAYVIVRRLSKED